MNSDIFKKTVASVTYLEYLCNNNVVLVSEIEMALVHSSKMKIELSRVQDNSLFIKTFEYYDKKLLDMLKRFNKC